MRRQLREILFSFQSINLATSYLHINFKVCTCVHVCVWICIDMLLYCVCIWLPMCVGVANDGLQIKLVLHYY